MIASLPMYDWPEVREATDALWQVIARHLAAGGIAGVPAALERGRERDEQWRSPDLLLSQTCGYPLTHALAGRVDLVATPCYGVRGCAGADYCSLVVTAGAGKAVGLADLRGATAACNSADSMSGMLALRAVIAPLSHNGCFFGRVIESGSHLASMRAVARGEADVAAIDCVSFALAERHHPDLVRWLRVIAETPRVPGLPLITARGRSGPERARLARALVEAFADPELAAARADVFITGLEFTSLTDYQAILDLEAAADAAGYTHLA